MSSNEINPYAASVSPQILQEHFRPQVDPGVGAWVDGNKLVMRIGSGFPPYCVKTGVPAGEGEWFKRNYQWCPPWIYILLVLGLIPLIIGVLITQKKATFWIGLSEETRAKRRKGILIAWLIGLSSIPVFLLPLFFDNTDFLVLSIPLAIFTFLGAIIYGSRASSLIRASKISKTHAWFKGVHPDILAQLPVWPVRG